jgi:hypothetical protein
MGAGQLNMHMHAAQHVTPADHLQVFHHSIIALGFGLAGLANLSAETLAFDASN